MNYIDPIPPKSTNKYKVKPRPLPAECVVEQPEILPNGSAKIELTRGLFAIVDQDMVEDLSRFNWSAAPDYRTCYALTRDIHQNTIRMHKHVMKIQNGSGAMIDHINGNGLDNRRENLRITNHSLNQLNRRDRTKLKKRFKGVCKGPVQGYVAMWKVDGKLVKKNFTNEVDAAMYYDSMIIKHKGPKSKTNLSMGRYRPEELSAAGMSTKLTEKFPGVETMIKATELRSDITTLEVRIEYLQSEMIKSKEKIEAYQKALAILMEVA